jgi:hypothetical protein
MNFSHTGAEPIIVGLKYKKVPGWGSHFGPSTEIMAMISFSSSLGSKPGSAIRVEDILGDRVVSNYSIRTVSGGIKHCLERKSKKFPK